MCFVTSSTQQVLTQSSLSANGDLEQMQATIAALKSQNKQLSEEVKQLVIAENKLYAFQAQLDTQVSTYRKLYNLGKALNKTLDISEVFTLTNNFVIYELAYERCLILRFNPHTDCFEIQSFDGYYEEPEIALVDALRIPKNSFNPDQFKSARGYDICQENCTDARLTSWRDSFGMDEYVVFDLRQEAEQSIGLLIAGNTAEMAKYQTQISEDEDGLLGLANAVSQITAAINNVHSYQALEEERSHLENRVLVRTQDLHDKNESLQSTLAALQQTQAQLVQSEKMSGLGQLVAGIAHEINNPVNFIYGNLKHADMHTKDMLALLDTYQKHHPNPHTDVQDLLEDIELDFLAEDLPKVMASMKMGATRIKEIVLSLRTFSRMDEAEMKSVDIHEGIDSTLLILDHKLKSKSGQSGLTVDKEYGDLPQIECYAGQLNQVFMNLLSNAIDATTSRKIANDLSTGKITIETSAHSDHVLIAIADNGPGIPEAIRHKIFNPFFTTKPVGQGTGLGLSISYQIVCDRHKGSLTCESIEGQGTQFLISIPIEINQ